MNKVEQIFIEIAVEREGLFLYSKENALEFVKECGKGKINLLGIDGFLITDESTQPRMKIYG